MVFNVILRDGANVLMDEQQTFVGPSRFPHSVLLHASCKNLALGFEHEPRQQTPSAEPGGAARLWEDAARFLCLQPTGAARWWY